jgi:hypothetical protein
LGVKHGDLDAMEVDGGKYLSSVSIKTRQAKFYLEIINVYGPVKYERKGEFLQELYQKIRRSNIPLMIGEDFNMIRYVNEKSSSSDHTIWMDMFNSFINDTTIIELIRRGSRFTCIGPISKKTLSRAILIGFLSTNVGNNNILELELLL